MSTDKAVELYKKLENAWARKDLDSVGENLSKLKILLLNLSFLPTGANASELDTRLLLIARSMLEIGALWSLERSDVASFERYVAQLKCYYFDYAGAVKASDYMYTILGLNLMRLLAQNRLAEFHTELELFPPEQLKNIYLKKPVTLEQFMMEGSYYKVFLSKEDIPNPYYGLFIDSLISTIKDEIASCIEKACSQVSVEGASRLLMIETKDELRAYVGERDWKLDSSGQWFVFSQKDKQETEIVKSPGLILQCLGYARELEKIV